MNDSRAPTEPAHASLRHRPRVYNLPAGLPFLDLLAQGIWSDAGHDKLRLARATVLLPNRRACRNLRDAFLRLTDGAPLLLPRLQPVGDVDDDELILNADDGFDLPPAIAPLQRQLLLTNLVLGKLRDETDPGVASRLAEALASLLDSAQIDDVSLDRLDDMVPESFADHWQKTIAFLQIIRDHWPNILAERGQMDPVARRMHLIRALAQRWRARPPADLVYAAGSTGSIPATAELLGVVAHLPTGKLILPGLDLALDDAAWDAVAGEPSHPQHGLRRLIEQIGLKRSEIRPWPGTDGADTQARAQMLSGAQRPAITTDSWLDQPLPPDAAFTGLRRIDAASPRDEAGAIALVMRETLETPGRTAALITPDRSLARRVIAELARWNVVIDDSAGVPLSHTGPGVFFRLIAQVVGEQAAPAPLLALLKHPLAAGGLARGTFLAHARYLERRVLRGPRPARGFRGLAEAVANSHHAADLQAFAARLAAHAQPLETLMASEEASLADLVTAHTQFAEWLATSSDGGQTLLWHGDAGEAVANFVGELRQSAPLLERIPGRAWPSLLDALLAGQVVRPRHGSHPRLSIWGLLEARLQRADVLILGGLNEGTWPPEPREDPWMSRPMRKELGLAPPERRIGLSAHDFAQAAASPMVVLTRAGKIDGAPTVPSRWLLRLDAMLANDARWKATSADDYADWHRRLDAPAGIAPVKPPEPRPPVAARPRKLSVTQVETWIRDPYAIFARHILRLDPLDPIDADPGALERGQIIHEALDAFMRDHQDELPDDALARLIACGEAAFRDYIDRPSVRAFWWPRFQRIARWFIAFERARRADGAQPLASELRGVATFAGPAGAFALTCKADRIDAMGPGALAIIDYKTGQPPSGKQIAAGLSPQLPLEAMIALAGGFEGISGSTVGELAHVRLSGGVLPGEYIPVNASRDRAVLTPDMLAAAAAEGLRRRIAQFDQPRTAYLSRPRPQWISREGDYDHLARVREWSQIEDDLS
jgi:ATP-dependent helicase/nuclease subunit B